MTRAIKVRRLRIPVRNVEGVWECAFGGGIPVRPGADAELLISRSLIIDKAFLKALESPGKHKVLAEGSRLLVSLTIKPEAPAKSTLLPFLLPYTSLAGKIATKFLDIWNPSTLHFVEVALSGPDEKQARRFGTTEGGLWLLTEDVQTTGIASTTVRLPPPISERPVASLNHAFTKLSEVYETWRISHTGNVYSRVLYEAKNGRWYPLDVLRNSTLASQEHEIAGRLWEEFMRKMTNLSKPSSRK